MKLFLKCFFALLLSSFITSIFAQDADFKSAKEKNKNKPELFLHDEKKIQINEGFFNRVFSKEQGGDTINLNITPNVFIKGVVVNAIFSEDFDIISISSTNIEGLRLLISRKHFNPGVEKYFGFVLCTKHKDGLKLEKDEESGNYFWAKKEMSEIIPD